MGVGWGIVGAVYTLGALAIVLWLRKPLANPDKPESLGFFVTVLATSVFVLPEGVLYVLAGSARHLLPGASWMNVIWLARIYALATLAVGWLLLGIGFVRRQPPSRRTIAVACGYLTIFGTAIAVDIAVPEASLLLDRSATTFPDGLIAPETGIGFDVHTVVSYGCVLTATGLITGEAVRSDGLRRKQSVVLAAASMPPILMTTLHLYLVHLRFDLTAFGLVWSIPVIGWGIYRMELLDIAPVAREIVLSEMDDAVITLDSQDRVLDCNAVARELFDIAADEDCFGMSAEACFSSVPADTLQQLTGVDEVDTQLEVPFDGERRHFSPSISPIRNGKQTKGRVIVLRDITPISRREQALEDREEELDLVRQVFSRVLRHNLRTELTVIRGTSDRIASDTGSPHEELAQLIVDSSDDLLAISKTARQIERIVDEEADTVEYDLRELTERTIDSLNEEYPDGSVEFVANGSHRVHCIVGFEAALRNLLEHAITPGRSAD
jgi:PAS domain-containing protein